MKNKIQHLFLMVLFFVFVSGEAVGLAQSGSFSVKYNADEQTVELIGSAKSGYVGEDVTISLLQEGKSLASPQDIIKENVSEYVQYATQTEILEDGSFKTDFRINSDISGKYQIRVRCPDDIVLTDYIFYISGRDIKSVLDRINSIDRNSTDAAAQTEDLILNSELMLMLQNSVFNDVLEKNLSLSGIYENVLDTKSYTKISQLLENIIKPSLVAAFYKLDDNELLKKYIGTYSEYFSEDELIYREYTELKNQEDVVNCIKGINYKDIDALVADYEQNTLLQALRSADSWSNMRSKLFEFDGKYHSKYVLFSKLNISEFNALSDNLQYNVIEYILKNKNITNSTDNFAKVFNDRINKEKSGKTESPSGSNSGGGGSGSGGVGNVSIVNKPDTDRNINSEDKPMPFNDLNGVLWAKESIEALFDAGIVSGRSETIFAPSESVTREEFIKMIVAGFGLSADGFECSFSDADSSQWYYTYLAAAEKHGITYGDGAGNFGVGEGITREDMAVMLYRMLDSRSVAIEKIKETVVFTDKDNISEYASEAVTALQQGGVINGLDNGSFAPKQGSTRAEAAVMIYGIMKIAGKM